MVTFLSPKWLVIGSIPVADMFFLFFCDHDVASATMLLPAGRGPTYTGRIRRHESAFFSSQVFFPSPHALVGWVRGMIFFLILLAGRPQQYNPIGLAYFSFFKRAGGFNYIIIKSFSATKNLMNLPNLSWQ
jgi:hypothetical protein